MIYINLGNKKKLDSGNWFSLVPLGYSMPNPLYTYMICKHILLTIFLNEFK